MPLIADTHLARMRVEHGRLLPDACDITRITTTETAGGVTETVATIATGLACRYSESLSPQDVAIAERHGISIDASLELPALSDITAADRVTVTVGGVVFGTFEVSGVKRRSWEVGRGVYLKREA